MKFVNGECPGGWSSGSPRGAGHSLRAAQAGQGLRRRQGQAHPQRPPAPARTQRLPAPTDDADPREEATGDVLNFISPITGLACFWRFIFRSFKGKTSPEATLISLSLFQPSFVTVTVGRRTDKGMRVTRATGRAVPRLSPRCPRAVPARAGMRQACCWLRCRWWLRVKPAAEQTQGLKKCIFFH